MNRVQVYWNIHRECWSVRSVKTRRVVRHAAEILLVTAVFHVSAAGRERVRRQQRKNVHAWVEGAEVGVGPVVAIWGVRHPVRYNPYTEETFVLTETREPVYQADLVWLTGNREVFIFTGGKSDGTKVNTVQEE